MQGSNFSREGKDQGREQPPPHPVAAQNSSPADDFLAPMLHQLEIAQQQIARQREELDSARVEVVAISQMERGRIGRDLHDVLGQILTAIAFLGKLLERSLQERGAPEAGDAHELCELAGEGIRQTRALARGLFPVDLRADELVPSLKALAMDTQHTFHIACHFDPLLESNAIRNDTVATHLYHIAQEAITNVVKHSNARSAQVRLHVRDGALILIIQDDGVGLRHIDKPRGIGLRIMSHRAGLLRGALSVESQPGHGTTVTCTIPADKDQSAAGTTGGRG